MSTPASRTPKRQRQKEGAQARRAAELAALRQQQRKRRVIRVVTFAAISVVMLFVISRISKDDSSSNDQATAGSTTSIADTSTTVAGAPVVPLECDGPDGSNTDTTKKPTVEVPEQPATALTCRDLVVGTGRAVTSSDTITVEYVGVAQSNGEEFDSTWDKGEPFTTDLNSVIAGWTEGIPGMKVGGRRQLVIPGDKAYGPEGRPPKIGPNDTLVFVVDVKDAKPAG